ncbi:hypothetical protein [Streptomyces spiramenti]|uniref:DUF3040 domain-containing protein n=1 Tax=Streptomyces spiramenti TaxID=2720606 RepID=A0ABX1AP53_9ACTN|nr:hypothetical protein [Streptomyces spiramenti]NJP68080.1 hypothetical protein [Streptomyces spiramenti]
MDHTTPATPGAVAQRARALVEAGDPRVAAVEDHLAPELPSSLSPDQRHYAAAVAVAVIDGTSDGDRGAGRTPARPRDRTAPRGGRSRAADRIGIAVTAVLFTFALAVLGAGVVWLWRLVL